MNSLPFFLADSLGIVFAFERSTLEGKIVLLFLLIGSIFSWSVMWTKLMHLRSARKQNTRFLHSFRASKSPLALYEQRASFPDSPLAAIYFAASKDLTLHLVGSWEIDETLAARLATAPPTDRSALSSMQASMERAAGEELLKLESQLILLATAVSGAPFIGLLGTVWGVMDAFSGIAQAGQASLSAMAPGVSGSLITTVVALLVAIPAMFGYNYLISSVRTMTLEMENFSSECASIFERKHMRRH